MAAPCALITSCSEYNPQEIVKYILNVTDLPEGQPVVESVMSYDWHVDTKYYTADVHLCTTSERTIGDESFAESVQAFVVYFDSHEKSSFQKVDSWLPYLAHIDPAVQILVCHTCRIGDAVSRPTALEWCIKNGFELVELEPEENSDDDDQEDDFAETVGPKRIVQALHAHTWPNLVLKNRNQMCSPFIRSLMQEEAALQSHSNIRNGESEDGFAGDKASASCRSTSPHPLPSSEGSAAAQEKPEAGSEPDRDGAKELEGTDKDRQTAAANGDCAGKTESASAGKPFEGFVPDDNELAMLAALGNEDPGEENFEQLLSKLHILKEKAASLPPDQRKTYAEQMAVTFWRAIGGDDDEIEGLFDED